MSTNFPTSLDTFPSGTTLAGHQLDTDPHSTLHGNLGDSVAALEAKVGADASAVTTTIDYKIGHIVATGDATGTLVAGSSAALTLKNTGPGATGPLGTAVRTNAVTIDAQGRVTALTDQAIALAITGDITCTAPGAATLATVNGSPGATGDATHVAAVTTNGKGLVTANSAVAIALTATGDATGTLPGALTLKNTGPGATGPLGTAARTNTVTIDAQGRVTALADQAIAIGAGAVSGLAAIATSGSATDLTAGTLPAGRFPALTGDITTVAGALASTLKNTGPGATGPLGTATRTNTVTIDAQGRVTALTDQAIALAITGDATCTAPGALTLATVNSSPGTTGDATHTSQLTTNGKGLVTANSSVAISLAASGDISGSLPGALTVGLQAKKTYESRTGAKSFFR